jgi:hypothetical protein
VRCVWFLGRRPGPRRRPPPFLSCTHTHVQQALAVLRAQGGEDVGQDEADGCDGKGGERREREVESEGWGGVPAEKKGRGVVRVHACPPLPPPTPSDRVRWQGRAAPHPGGVVGGHGGASEGGRGPATRGGGGRCGRAKQSKKKSDARRGGRLRPTAPHPTSPPPLYSPWKKLDLPDPLAPTVCGKRGGGSGAGRESGGARRKGGAAQSARFGDGGRHPPTLFKNKTHRPR